MIFGEHDEMGVLLKVYGETFQCRGTIRPLSMVGRPETGKVSRNVRQILSLPLTQQCSLKRRLTVCKVSG